jgi:isopentenyl diphosphate isomerase/L-lactate dehydrogenase-like FMN-dependent dehydrogenase
MLYGRQALPVLLHARCAAQIVSTMATSSLTEVAQESQHPCLLFQLYVVKDRDLVVHWVRQAEAAG